ncbi:uncharacterized protein [Chelonus insularis]|uniref:uncharacterized protein n=1 Tax=Chelonus insularis TaxID=460826 RepID=UPI00158D9F4C|nr:uncharacterized protein LOC118070207 [Chelonus insularis]
MLRNIVVLATACLCLVAAHKQADVHTADKAFLVKQKDLYSLFWHVDQPTTVNADLYQVARSWSIEEHIDSYVNQTVVHDFVLRYKHGLLHRGAVFSTFHHEHLEEAVALFKLFWYAKDYETFYNTAVWARFNVNEKLFTYALAVAIIHRPDTKYIHLPPLHEIMPHFFFNNEVIQAAYYAKMGDSSVKAAVSVKYREGGDVIIHSNYSGWYLTHEHTDEKLNYFTEDVGLNSYYFTFVHDYPHWMDSETHHLQKEVRGELYYYGHKQLLGRYYLERLSNDMGEIEMIDWHEPIITGYYPSIHHANGLPFPHRHSYSHVPHHKYDLVHDVEEYETRIHAAIDFGYVYDHSHPPKPVDIYTPEGFNILANIIEGNADSINVHFYGSIDHLCRKILGFGLSPIDKHHIHPSALEYYVTSLRDPAFWRIYKKIVTYFLKYKEHLPTYTHEELTFPGIKIDSVAVDKLLTYFEHYDSEISNGVPVSTHKDAETTSIKVRQHRLNHKPFTYHITVNSDKNVKAVVRVFLGPKFDHHGHEIDFVDNWVNFVELDQWVVDLKSGINKIERSSHESIYVVPDEPSGVVYWKKLVKAIETGEAFTYSSQVYGFPDRLILPKGKREGLPLKLFVFISEFDENHVVKMDSPVWGTTVVDAKPMGYPLDKPVVAHSFHVPNAYFKDVVVFHKHVEELNLTVFTMLKQVFLLACVTFIAVAAEGGFYYTEVTADKDFLLKQKKIYNLFYHVGQPNLVNQDLYSEGQAYSIEANIDSYTNKDAVNYFLELYKFGLLPKGELFSLYYPKLLTETKALFKLFYYAKDFDTFFKTALWARAYINEGEFLCALYQAVIRRPDTLYIQLPPPYEFYPYAFFNSEVIEAAKNIKLLNRIDNPDSNSYIIRGNYSGWYLNRDYDIEMKLKYFLEDIGLNTYYFFFRQNNPFWLSSEELGPSGEIRGEEYLYGHQQLFNRYNLERLANHLEKIEDFDWGSEFYPGYYPTMVYHNGLPYPQRPHWSKIPHYKYKFLFAIRDYELRISAAIDSGFILGANGKHHSIYTPEGLNMLGNLIEGNEDSCNKDFYGSIDFFARRILGFNLEPKSPYQVIPSALESSFSCMRDPAFYRLYKRISYFLYRYNLRKKPYTKEELVFPELKIESVAVDKLLTYFDDFDATISNGLPIASQKEAELMTIKVRQQRLNHKPFTIHITLNSDKAQKVAIQIFMGPKYDAQNNLLEFSESYKYFYEFDYWITDVAAGSNKLERNSHDFFFLMPDKEPSEIFYKRIEKALEGTDQFTYKQYLYGFPERLLLPKGRRGGSPYQLFIYVSPVNELYDYKSRVFGNYQFNKKCIGFPLDRPIYYPYFQGPNIFFKDIIIYHKSDIDPNATS